MSVSMLNRSIAFALLVSVFLVARGSEAPDVASRSVGELSPKELQVGITEKTGLQRDSYREEYRRRASSFGTNTLKVLGVSPRDMEQVCPEEQSKYIDCKTRFGVLLFDKGYEQEDLEDAVRSAKKLSGNTSPSKVMQKIPFLFEAAEIFRIEFVER